ncbi:MAG: hypothetical protein IKK58_02840 [Clostridia bacterium]|nr:hypothetical protein [Clostridia bacterium]
MELFEIILIGLLLAAVGSGMLVASAPVFGISYRTVLKRTIWFIVGCEVAIAAVFCVFNGVKPTFWGQLLWHGVRFMQICLMGFVAHKLHNLKADQREGVKRFPILHITLISLAAQVVQYNIITALY